MSMKQITLRSFPIIFSMLALLTVRFAAAQGDDFEEATSEDSSPQASAAAASPRYLHAASDVWFITRNDNFDTQPREAVYRIEDGFQIVFLSGGKDRAIARYSHERPHGESFDLGKS